MHGVCTELDRMPALMPNHVVVELKVPVVAKREQCRVAHGRELAAEGDLRISHVQRIRGHALQPCLGGKVVPGIGTRLPAGDREKPEPGFIQDIRVERMGPTRHSVNGVGAQVAAKTGQQALLQYARSEWIELRVHRTATREGRWYRSLRTDGRGARCIGFR